MLCCARPGHASPIGSVDVELILKLGLHQVSQQASPRMLNSMTRHSKPHLACYVGLGLLRREHARLAAAGHDEELVITVVQVRGRALTLG